MKKIFSIIIVCSFLALSSCASMQVQEGKKGQVGAVGGAATGAILGQIIGEDTEATLIGAAIGGLLGYIVGNEMDKSDKTQLINVYDRAPSRQVSSWVNPDTGNQFRVVPEPAFTDPRTDRICRRAEITAIIDGVPQKTYSTACRDEFGNWHLQN